jgi:hypothetical protein
MYNANLDASLYLMVTAVCFFHLYVLWREFISDANYNQV